MRTTSPPNPAHVPISDLYDPDDVFTPNSPLMQPIRPVLQLTPSPPPESPNTKVKASLSDAVLVGQLDGGRHPELAIKAGQEPLAYETEEDDGFASSNASDVSDTSDNSAHTGASRQSGRGTHRDRRAQARSLDLDPDRMACDPPNPADTEPLSLTSLARSALAAFEIPDPKPVSVDAGPTPPVTENDVVRERSIPAPLSKPVASRRDDRPAQHTGFSPYSPQSIYSPGMGPIPPGMDARSPPGGPPSHGEGLPPLQMNSPRSETNGQSLPSIRAQFGSDFGQLPSIHQVADRDGLRISHPKFPHSPPTPLPRLSSMHHASPPISPAETFRREPLSPYITATSPYYPPQNGYHRSPHDYASSATETPGSDQSGSTPATSIADKMNMGDMTSQQGVFVCKFSGCTAAPFQTQYLLNSHANVHSSARPHYCPVGGCLRSEGGKGFKRKNEMIRHGLVHESPGYVCPFCPDREHKYPRPDNLQRHVRVHHPDKDKDDPMLRDVLAQRPDGPSKGRRRRGGPG